MRRLGISSADANAATSSNGNTGFMFMRNSTARAAQSAARS
jgi:hypothetical protein